MGFTQVHRVALFQLTREANIIFDHTGRLFDAYAYSRFKYGSKYMTKHYAQKMQTLLQQEFPHLWDLPSLWLTSSAYKFVATASHGLAENLYQQSFEQHSFATKFVKIGRTRLFPADYGNLSQAEREAIMQQVDLQFELDYHLPQPEDLLIIDDIRITGAHENRLIEFAEREGFKRVYFAYIAQLSPKAEPTTEHWLNHTAIRDLRDLWNLWTEEGCLLNARICKFLLSYTHLKSLARFADALPTELSTHIAEAMWQDGYAHMDMYTQNWEIWEKYKMPQHETPLHNSKLRIFA